MSEDVKKLTDAIKSDDMEKLTDAIKSPGYRVFQSDGYATAVVQRGDDANIQVMFWTDDVTYDAERTSVDFDDPRRYEISLKRVLETSVKLKPDVAYQLAQNLLRILDELDASVRKRFPMLPNKGESD